MSTLCFDQYSAPKKQAMLIITKQPHHGHVHCNGTCITAAVAVSDVRRTAFTLSVYHQSTHVEIHNRHRRYILPHSSCAFIPFRAYRNHLPNPNWQCAYWHQHRSHPLRALANHHCRSTSLVLWIGELLRLFKK